MVAYMDAASDRLGQDFEAMVEATRVGTILAHDQRAFRKWQSQRSGKSAGLSGQALESAVMGLRRSNPEYVVVGP